MTHFTQQTAAFEGINDPRDRQITTIMRQIEMESVIANCTWVPEATSNAATAKIEVLTAQIEAIKASKRGM